MYRTSSIPTLSPVPPIVRYTMCFDHCLSKCIVYGRNFNILPQCRLLSLFVRYHINLIVSFLS